MQLSKKQIKQIISEEMEVVANEKDEIDTLLESYAAGYEASDKTVSKDALLDILEVMEESTIPLSAFQAFMENLPEDTIVPLLREVVEPDEE